LGLPQELWLASTVHPMKRLWLIALLVLVSAALVLWWYWAAAVELARRDIQATLTRRFGLPAEIRHLDVSLWPPRIHIEGVTLGGDPLVLRLGELTLRLAPLSTVAEARPVVTLAATSLFVDATRLSRRDTREPSRFALPAFRVGGMKVLDARVRFPIGDEVGELFVERTQARLESSLLRTRLSAGVKLDGCALSRLEETLDLGEVRVIGEMDGHGIVLSQASLNAPGRSIEITGTDSDLHKIRAELDVHDLVIIDDDFSVYSGAGRASGSIHGPFNTPSISGAIEIDDLRAAGRLLGTATAAVQHQGRITRFDDVVLRDQAGSLRGSVVVEFHDRVPIEAKVNWDVTSVERLLNKVGLELSFASALKASSTVTGQFDPLDLRIAAMGVLAAGPEVAKLKVESRIAKKRAKVEYDLEQTDNTRIAGQVDVREGALGGRVQIESGDLRALSAFAPQAVAALDLGGTGMADVVVGGTTRAPRFEGTVAAGPIDVAEVRLQKLDGAFAWTETTLTLPQLDLTTVTGGKASATGTVALEEGIPNDWKLALRDVDVELVSGIWQRVGDVADIAEGGTVTGSVQGAGAWKHLSLSADFVADSTRVGGEPFDRVDVKGLIRPQEWQLEIEATHSRGVTVQVSGGAGPASPAELLISATPVDLHSLDLGKRFDLHGSLALQGRLNGSFATPGGEVDVSATDLSLGTERIGQVTLRATGAAGKWRLEGEAPAKQLFVRAEAAVPYPFPYKARIEWQELPFDVRARATDRLNGTTTGEVLLSGQIAHLRGSEVALRVSETQLQWGDSMVSLETPIQLTGREGTFAIAPFIVAGKDTNLTVAGSIDRGRVTAAVKGAVALDYLELLGEPLVSASGSAEIDMTIRNAAGKWTTEGMALLRPAVFDLGASAAFTDVTARINARGRVFDIEELSARSGGGTVSVSGLLDLDRGPQLKWYADGVALNLREEIEMVASGRGTIAGAWRDLTVGGTVDVQSALYSRDFEVVDLPGLFAPRVKQVAEISTPPNTIRLDLTTKGRGGLYIDNNVAQVELWLDGKAKGTLPEPAFVGTVGIIGGKVKVRRRTFELTGGAIDFRGRLPANPNLNISAETEVSTREADYLITATVTGTARDPIVQFGSDDPTLTQTDILSLVAVGRTAAELQGETQGVSQIDALALLPTAPVEEQVSELVGIDRFEIDLAQTNSQGDVSPGLTIGKDITERFRGAVTTSFDVDARNAVVLEYDLTRRVSLVGQWEAETESQAGAFGGGVRVRYEFRRLPFSLLRRQPAAELQPDVD
jgi:autotransporter translocation and assembly factor TamB